MKGTMVLGITLVVAAGVGLLAAGPAADLVRRPAPPSEWATLRVGMPREAVLARLRDPVVDLRDLKGFELATRVTEQSGYPTYWQLLLYYDDAGPLARATVRFTNPAVGLRNVTQPLRLVSDASFRDGRP